MMNNKFFMAILAAALGGVLAVILTKQITDRTDLL